MTKLASFFFLLCLSCFISHCLSRPIGFKSTSDSSEAAVDTTGKFGEQYWFDHPWLHAHPPLSANYWPKKPWPSGGYQWGPWPGMPEKQWPFAQSPMPNDGWKWWPKNEEVAADEVEEAAVAAPPLAA